MSDNGTEKENEVLIISQGTKWIAISVGVSILPIIVIIGFKAFLGFTIDISDYIDDITLVVFPISISLFLLCIDKSKKIGSLFRKFNVIFSFIMAGFSIIFYALLYFFLLGIIYGEGDGKIDKEVLETRFIFLCIYVILFVVYTSVVGYKIEQCSSETSEKKLKNGEKLNEN